MKQAVTRRVSVPAAITAAIAVAYTALSLADGGFEIRVIAGATFVIWWAVIVGLALGIFPRSTIPTRAIVAGASLCALGLFAALSMGWASDDALAFIDVVRIAGYLGLFLLVLLATPTGGARVWLYGIAIGLVAVAALALGSRLEPSLPGGNVEIATFLPEAQGRLSYPIGYWNALGACMSLGIVLLTWLGAQAASRVTRSLAIGAIPMLCATVFLTSSRGAVVAGVAGLVTLIAVGPARLRLLGGLLLGGAGGGILVGLLTTRDDLVDGLATPAAESQGTEVLVATIVVMALVGVARYLLDAPLERLTLPRLATRIALGVLALGVVVGVIAADPARQLDEFNDPPAEERASTGFVTSHISSLDSSGRYQYWEVAVDAFEDDPVTGAGAGSYLTLWNQNAPFTRPIRQAHSLFFETLAELGIPGLLLLLGFFAPAGYAVWRARDGIPPGGAFGATAGIFAAGVVSAAIDWTWEVPAAFAPVAVAIALLTGVGLNSAWVDSPRGLLRGSAGGRRRYGWGIATLVAGWAAIWASGVVFFTEAKLAQSQAAAARGDLEDAAQDARDAATLQPWASQPWLQLALLEELTGDLEAAQEALHNASVRAPEDWRLWLINTRLEVGLGDLEGARESLAKAEELNPQAQIFQGGLPEGEERFQASIRSGSLADQIGITTQPAPQAGEEEEEQSGPKPGVPAHRQARWAVSGR
jgi:tetratricopeptide (TPR) repeat protein